MVTSMKRELVDRFADKVALNDDGCLIWLGAHTDVRPTSDYGLIYVEGRMQVAHRVAVFLHTGRWPAPDMEVDHLCNVTLCVHVDHLEVVTRAENQRRRRLGWSNRPDPALCMAGIHPWVPENLIKKGRYFTCKRCYYDRNNEWYRRREAS